MKTTWTSTLTSTLALAVVLAPATAIAEAQWTFSDLDSDGNLELTEREFEQVSREAFTAWDQDGDESLAKDELYGGLFEVWDADNDGALTEAEYRESYTTWFGDDIQAGFDSIAGDADTIGEEEFVAGLGDRLDQFDAGTDGMDWERFHAALYDAYDRDDDDAIDEEDYAAFDDTELTNLEAGEQAAALQQPVGAEVDEVTPLTDWDAEALYADGLSVEYMIDEMEVYGPTGDEIGSIENVVFSRDGRVLSLIAEVGGFWDMFDTHVNVPWDEVDYTAGRIAIPVTEETVDDYVVKADYLTAAGAAAETEVVEDDPTLGAQAFRASELIGDYARVEDQGELADYGYINDLIIRNGVLEAVVVNPQGTYGITGPYAYPYYGYGWAPGAPYYDMPYDRTEVVDSGQIDYDRFDYN